MIEMQKQEPETNAQVDYRRETVTLVEDQQDAAVNAWDRHFAPTSSRYWRQHPEEALIEDETKNLLNRLKDFTVKSLHVQVSHHRHDFLGKQLFTSISTL